MTITGLENDYYLTQNDIWVKVTNVDPTNYLELKVTRIIDNVELKTLRMQASPQNDYSFNFSQVVRALFPEADHLLINTLRQFKFDFTISFVNTATAPEVATLNKYFQNGSRAKNNDDTWNLEDGKELIILPWIVWSDIELPSNPLKINGGQLEQFAPTNYFRINRAVNCTYKVLKFRNSLGGYQYFVFENFETKLKTKSGKTIDKITYKLQDEGFSNSEMEADKQVTFYGKTDAAVQNVFEELVKSNEVYIWNPNGAAANSSGWFKMKTENNDSAQNTWERSYNNEITFSFEGNVNLEIDFSYGTGGGQNGSNIPDNNNNLFGGSFIDITGDY